tara:strand:+ start:24635 stop:25768 length:1134 start_codon:yes stop_codon:yes gene_type:complete
MHSKTPHMIRILIVEDNPEDVILYKRRLDRFQTSHEFSVDDVSTIAEAKEKASENTYDCFVVDYNLPDGAGMDFVQYINEVNPPETPIALLMITGQGNEEIAVEAMKSGVHDYLTKNSITDGYFVGPLLNALNRSRLTSQLFYYQKELERSNKELSEFTHTASHDLKAPLRRIITYCDMLAEDAQERLIEDDITMLERMKTNAARMQNLVNDLLTFSLIRAEEEPLENIHLSKILEEARDELKEQIAENKAVIKVESLPEFKVFPLRLKQLFINLISNALKYRSEETPEIVVSTTKIDANKVEISFKDNGLGVDPQFHEDIFKDFKRLHNQDSIEGTGLGLSICKRICEKHGGAIRVESAAGQGANFIVTLGTAREN